MGTPGAGMMAVMNMSGAFTNIAEHPSALGGITPMATAGNNEEGYFEQPAEYFPPMPPPSRGRGLPHEQSQPGGSQSESPLDTDRGSNENSRRPSSSGVSTAESELDLHNLGRGSSVATTVDEDAQDASPEEKVISGTQSTLVGEMGRMSLERGSSDSVIKMEDKSDNLLRPKSVDANMLQFAEPGPSTSTSTSSPEQAHSSTSPQQSQAIAGAPSPMSSNAKPKARSKPHPTFQASEFASIVSGFQGIVPPHADDRNAEGRSGLTPGHGRRASWTPGTEYASYM